MAKLYFLGGEDLGKRDCEQINKKAFADAGGTPSVLVFIGWASKSLDETEKYRHIIMAYFREMGAKKIVFAELSDSLETVENKMKNADLIYLPGGDTELLVETIKKKGLETMLRKYDKVIVGNSAGALALCEDCLIAGAGSPEESAVRSGLGIVDFCVDVHYNPSRDSRLSELSKKRRIYAVAEKSALICDEARISFSGMVYLFDKGKKIQCW